VRQKPTIGPYDLELVTRKLVAFAASAGLEGDSVKYALVDRELLPHDKVSSNGALLMRALNLHRRVVPVTLPFAAERIGVRNNIRIFGLARRPGMTASVQVRSGRGQSVFRECRARAIVSRHLDPGNGVAIPTVRSWDRRNGAWLIEDFVDGSVPSDEDIGRLATTHLAGLYRATVRPRAVRRAPGGRAFVDELDRVLRATTTRFPALRPDDRWLVGLCHADLDIENTLADRAGRIWILDWEKAGVVPLIADLGRLLIGRPGLKDALLGLLNSFDRDGVTLPPVHQLALGAAFEAQRFRRRLGMLPVGSGVPAGKPHEAALRDDKAMLLAAERAILDLEAAYA
jgi:hypothetical protein